MVKEIHKGDVFGKLTAVEEIQKSSKLNHYHSRWLCKCECGNDYEVDKHQLLKNKSTMCRFCSAKISGLKKSPDLTGKIFGELTVIRRATKEEKNKGQYWLCRCSCGNEIFTNASNLNNGHTYRCNECGQIDSIENRRKYLEDERFGNLTVLKTIYHNESGEKYPKCECLCDCGNIINVYYSNLTNGNTTSCGCTRKENVSIKVRKSILNQRFSSLVVTKEFFYKDANKRPEVECVCDCGNIIKTLKVCVVEGRTTSCGCMKTSSLERNVNAILKDIGCNYEREYTFDDCFNVNKLKFDFVIFDDNNNIKQIIETDGEQHYRPVEYFGGEENFKLTQLRDNIKNEYCKSHNIPLLRLPYYLSKEEMENEIKKVI